MPGVDPQRRAELPTLVRLERPWLKGSPLVKHRLPALGLGLPAAGGDADGVLFAKWVESPEWIFTSKSVAELMLEINSPGPQGEYSTLHSVH